MAIKDLPGYRHRDPAVATGRDVVGSDHADRRQPRNLHEDRFSEERSSPSAMRRRQFSAATASSCVERIRATHTS